MPDSPVGLPGICFLDHFSFYEAVGMEGTEYLQSFSQREVLACRQFLAEFSHDIEILCSKADGRYVSYKLSELLPHLFNF